MLNWFYLRNDIMVYCVNNNNNNNNNNSNNSNNSNFFRFFVNLLKSVKSTEIYPYEIQTFKN